jgi:DNA-binding CsgD family transcriptional regulator
VLAQAHGLMLWRLRATHELGTIDLLAEGRVDTLEQARVLASDLGAFSVAAVVDVQLAAGYHLLGRADDATTAGDRAATAGRRLRVGGIEKAGTCLAVLGHALRRDRAALDRAAVEAERIVEGEGGWLASLSGDGRGSYALLSEDRPGSVRALERAAAIGRSAPRLPSPWWGLWALLRAVRSADAREALREVAEVPVSGHNAMMCGYAEAVLLGRADQAAAASNTFNRANAAATPGWWGHLGRRLAAEAALADGWGDPVEWLSAAATFFDGFPAAPVASACRSLLRRAGVPVPRRPTGMSAELADRGITAREAEVLALLGEGLSNRDVAARLYLSPRTVEKHVENLSRKLGTRSGGGLVAYAATLPRPR